MAGTAYTSFAVGDPNINAVMLNLAGINTGYNALTLTQMGTTTVPAIAAGSKIEVGGTLFKFDAEEAISGSPSDGTVYVMLVPSGSSITAQFTNTAPTWSDSKQGWYGTGTTAGNRYASFAATKQGSVYIKHFSTYGGAFLQFQNTQIPGVASGETLAINAWTKRNINTFARNDIGASLAANNILLGAGFWFIDLSVTSYQTNYVKLMLFNETLSLSILVGQNVGAGPNTYSDIVPARLRGWFYLYAPNYISVYSYQTRGAGSGGIGVGSGEKEVYLDGIIKPDSPYIPMLRHV